MHLKQYKLLLLCLSAFTLCFILYDCWSQHGKFAAAMIRLNRNQHVNVDNPYIIEATKLPENPKFNPTIANGYLGHAIYSDTIYKNGLYNGEKGDSHRARIPGTLPYLDIGSTNFTTDKSEHYKLGYLPKYVLDIRNGTYLQVFDIENIETGEILCTVSQEFYAHRFLTRVLVTQIFLSFKADGSIQIPLKSSAGQPSTDIKLEILSEDKSRGSTTFCGHTLIPEQPGSDIPICVIATDFPEKLSINASAGKVFTFFYLTSFGDTLKEAETFYQKALEMEENGTLLVTHKREWQRTWDQGSITVKSEGPLPTSSFVSGLYYMLSVFPPASYETFPYHFFGASPGGLTNGGKDQDYWGHVFWDQDFWMLPALLPLFPNAVLHGLRYRIARLGAAKAKAAEHGFGGAMYPWESAYTGMDVCPGQKYRVYEQHVTADLIHTLKQYVYATGDWKFLMEEVPSFVPLKDGAFHHTAWDLTRETARFWCSRVAWDNRKNSYVLHDVMGPDEYYSPINNSAFTNAVATQNLKFALEASDVLNLTLPEKRHIQKVAKNIFLPYDKELDFHPEFEGFDQRNDTVKQADAIMLGFPLMADISPSSRQQDLTIYGNVTDPEGPAMTWGMFAINWHDLGNFSTADEYFLRQLGNIQPPFQIWAEEPDGEGAVNFLTGIGGYIQSILYGYLKLRFFKNYMTLTPRLPLVIKYGVGEMKIFGLKFHGAILDVVVGLEMYCVTLAGFSASGHGSVTLHAMTRKFILTKIGDHVSIPVNEICHVSVHF